MTIEFTKDESHFLKSQGYSVDSVFDGRRKPSKLARAEAKAQGKVLILGTPCSAAGHRLRTRGGHCAQCNPAVIAYATRHSTSGIIYIAASEKGQIYKIGSTQDKYDRERQLGYKKYGGYSDWVVLASAEVTEMGAAETEISKILSHYKVEGLYWNETWSQMGKEMYKVDLRMILKAFGRTVKNFQGSKFWKHEQLERFHFASKS